MTSVQTILTAAGDSRALFLPAGFGCPKSLIPWKGREVLAWAIESYAVGGSETTVAVHAVEDDEWGIGQYLHRQFPELSVVRIPARTRGALASALLALQNADDRALIVAAGDSMIDGGIARFVDEFLDRGIDAGTIAFPSESPRWSYISVDARGHVRQVAEKQVIGPLATTGVFFFKHARHFLEAATWCLLNNATVNGNFYVSSTLNHLITRGWNVGYAEIARDAYQSWSLPIDFAVQSE